MAWIISNGKFVISNNGKFTTGRRPCIEYAFGGTATGVAVGFVGAEKEAQYKSELSETYSAERLANSKIIQLYGKKAGTVKFKITTGVTDKDAPLELLLRGSDGTWASLYNDYLPSDGYITVSVSEFGSIIGITDDYSTDVDISVLFDKNNNLLITKKENL